MFKGFPHKKDEALALDIPYVENLPIPALPTINRQQVSEDVEAVSTLSATIRAADRDLADWLRIEMGLGKLPGALAQASRLDADGFVAGVRAALPKRQAITPTKLRQLRDAFADTAEPARAARTAALNHERALSGIVNSAYGLTPEDVALMWRTAPPRMPLAPPPGITPPPEEGLREGE